MNRHVATTILVLSGISGCTSDSTGVMQTPDPVPPPPPSSAPPPDEQNMHIEGVWQGTLTSTTDNQSYPAYLMIDGWSWSVVLTESFVLVGPLSASTSSTIGGSLSGIRMPGTTWRDGSTVDYFNVSGTISDDHYVEADYQSSVDKGIMALSWAEQDVHSSLGFTTVGLWGLYDSDENILATLGFEGIGSYRVRVSGSHVNGCTYAGEAESWTSLHSFNFENFEVSNCPVSDGIDINGVYVGTGAIFKAYDPSGQDLFAIALHNQAISLLDRDRALSFFLRRIPE